MRISPAPGCCSAPKPRVDGAETAGELCGRVLVVFAAQHYASQLVLPTSQRSGSVLPRSHNDVARKAFERVTKRVLPASHKQLQRAFASEARTYHAKVDELADRTRAAQTGDAAPKHDIHDTDNVDIDLGDVDID